MVLILGEIHKRLSPMTDIKVVAEELIAMTNDAVQKMSRQLCHNYEIYPDISGCIINHICHDRLPLTKKQKQNKKAKRKTQRISRRKNNKKLKALSK